MIRRRNNVRKQGRVKIREPEHDYSETEAYLRRKMWGYETRKPERYHSEYNYNTYEDWYNGWKDEYRPTYSEDEYSVYDSQYDSDDDGSYRYNSRSRYYDDYYDSPEYSSYDQYNSAYKEDGSHSECRTCNKRDKRRRERMLDDSSFMYRYEEDHPKRRHSSHSYKQKNKTITPVETNRTRLENDMDIYAIHNILGQKGFMYRNRYNTSKPTLTSEVVSETEIDSEGYKGRIQKGKRKPEYHVYTTQTNVTPVFDKKIKSRYPEKLISVTDYEESPMLAFKNKNKRGYRLNDQSDVVYLPVVMKTKYHKGKASEQNVSDLKRNRKDIAVYTVSTRPSSVFKKAHVNSYNLKKIESKTKNDLINQTQKTGSPFVYTASEVRNNNMVSLLTNQNKHKSGLRQSKAQPTYQSGVNKNSQLKSIIKQSNAVPKYTGVSKKSYANDQPYLRYPGTSTTDLDTEGQYQPQSVLKQSTADPRSQNIEGSRKSSLFERKSLIGNLQNDNFSNERVQKDFSNIKNVLIQSQSSVEEIKGIDYPQHYINTVQNVEINQNTMPKSILRQTSCAPKNQSQMVKRQSSMYVDQVMEKEKQNIPKNIAKQDKVARRTQGYVDSDQIMGTEKEFVQKSIIRQGSTARRGQSFVENVQVKGIEGNNTEKSIAGNSFVPEIGQIIHKKDDVMGIEDPSAPKNMIRQSIVPEMAQNYMGREQVVGKEDQNIHKSMIRQSAAQRGQSFVGRDQLIATEGDKTKRSTARLSTAPQRRPSYINKDDIMGTEGKSAQRSMARNINMSQKNQSFVNRKQTMEPEINNTQKNITRQSSVGKRGQSFIDSAQIIGVEGNNIQRSMAVQRILPEGGRSVVDRGEVMGTEGQNIQKSIARQSSVAQRKQSIGGQNIQKSMVRQSSIARMGKSFMDNDHITGIEGNNIQKRMTGQSVLPGRGQSIVDRGEIMGTEGQITQKSMARQSSVAQRKQSIGGQNTLKSTAKQSSVEKPGQSFVDRTQTVGTENKSTPKSIRQSNVARRDQTFLGEGKSSIVHKYEPVSGLQEIETPNQQPQVSVFRPSTAYNGQQESLAVRQQVLSIDEQDAVADIQHSVDPDTTEKHGKLSTKSKRPTKSKSKSLLKKALNKLSAFQGQPEKLNHSDSTAPILDVILNDANIESRIEYQHQPDEPLSISSMESFKQPEVSKKPKKSTKSKLKSLLWKPKKSQSRQKTLPNSENAQASQKLTMTTYQTNDEQQPSEFYKTSDKSATEGFPLTSEGTFDLPDEDVSSENQEPKESSDHLRDFFETTLKGYDLTPIIYFLHIAQLIVGVTMFDKLMEVLEVF